MDVGERDFAHNSVVLDEIKKWAHNKDLFSENEAQTRFNVIDRLIKEFLGWRNGHISLEEFSEGTKAGYVDYILRSGDNIIVIEAKKIGSSFPYPSSKEKLKLSGVVLSQGEIANALNQVHQYAQSKSATLAVVTNGKCWCLYGLSGFNSETYAYVLHPFDIDGHSEKLFEYLGIHKVESGSIERLSNQAEDIHNRLISAIYNPDARVDRNNIADHIEPALDRALRSESILNNPGSLEWTFVATEGRAKFDKTLGMHFADIKSKFIEPARRIHRGKANDHLEQIVKNSVTSNAPPLTLIIGPVGAGKTTYLKHFELVSGKSVIQDKNTYWIYIDFEELGIGKSVKKFIYEKLNSFLDDQLNSGRLSYKGVVEPAYRSKVEALRRSVYAPISNNKEEFDKRVSELIEREYQEAEPYIDRIFSFLSTENTVIIVLDNTDLYEKDELEAEVFAEGLSLSKRIKSNVIVSIRDRTYIKHSSDSTFDAYELRKLWLDPPPLKSVLKKRLSYAKYILKEKPVKVTAFNGMQFEVPDLGEFFEIVQSAILSGETGDFIESIAGINIRKGISLIINFLTSGHVNADKAIKTYLDEKPYYIPFQEIFKGCMFGQWKHFKEERSESVNLFDPRLGGRSQKLSRKMILDYLYRSSRSESTMEVSVEELIRNFAPIGLSDIQIVSILNFFTKKALVRNSIPHDVENQSTVSLTKTGGYYVGVLTNRFQYVEACIYDTAVENGDFWDEIFRLTQLIERETNMYDRMLLRRDRIICFTNYLIEIEEEVAEISGIGYFHRNMNEIKKLLIEEADLALQRIKKWN